MYKTFITLQFVGIILFCVIFAASYLCRDYVRELANEFICQEIEPTVSAGVGLIKTHLDNPLLAHLSKDKIELARQEIDRYESAPLLYITTISARSR